MEKEFVPYDRSLRLKAIGFDEPCIAKFINKQFAMNVAARWYKHNSNEITSGWISAPTFSQAFRWFREKYDLHLLPIRSVDKWYSTFGSWIDSFEIYEQAELACLDKLLEIVEGIES